jgi:hypothetical protein
VFWAAERGPSGWRSLTSPPAKGGVPFCLAAVIIDADSQILHRTERRISAPSQSVFVARSIASRARSTTSLRFEATGTII